MTVYVHTYVYLYTGQPGEAGRKGTPGMKGERGESGRKGEPGQPGRKGMYDERYCVKIIFYHSVISTNWSNFARIFGKEIVYRKFHIVYCIYFAHFDMPSNVHYGDT